MSSSTWRPGRAGHGFRDGGGKDFFVRNSRFPETGPLPAFTPAEVKAFVLAAKAGEFDDLVWPVQVAR